MTTPLDFLRRRNREEKEARPDPRAPARCRHCESPLTYLGAILGGVALYGCRECHLVYWEKPR